MPPPPAAKHTPPHTQHTHTRNTHAQDKINAFWEVTKRELAERRAELHNRDRELEEAEERHGVEVKVRWCLFLLRALDVAAPPVCAFGSVCPNNTSNQKHK